MHYLVLLVFLTGLGDKLNVVFMEILVGVEKETFLVFLLAGIIFNFALFNTFESFLKASRLQ